MLKKFLLLLVIVSLECCTTITYPTYVSNEMNFPEYPLSEKIYAHAYIKEKDQVLNYYKEKKQFNQNLSTLKKAKYCFNIPLQPMFGLGLGSLVDGINFQDRINSVRKRASDAGIQKILYTEVQNTIYFVFNVKHCVVVYGQ